MMKYQKTYCSQCGAEFGAANKGFSHCSDHVIHLELVRQYEREQLRNRTHHEQQLMDGQAFLLKRRTE